MKKLVLLTLVLASIGCQHQAVAPARTGAPHAVLSGKIIESSTKTPLEGVYVYAYRESTTHFFGPPNALSAATGADGTYRLELPAGTYYLFARKRQSGEYIGPLYKEDYFSEPQKVVSLVPGEHKADNFSVQKLEGQQFFRPEKIINKTTTVISGRVLDANGKPAFGAFIIAYRNHFQKQLPPDYGSTGTDASGKYSLFLDEGGKFVVGARMNAKEPPAPGEPIGFYRNDRETPLEIATGASLENIDITLAPFAGSPQVKPGAIPMQQ